MLQWVWRCVVEEVQCSAQAAACWLVLLQDPFTCFFVVHTHCSMHWLRLMLYCCFHVFVCFVHLCVSKMFSKNPGPRTFTTAALQSHPLARNMLQVVTRKVILAISAQPAPSQPTEGLRNASPVPRATPALKDQMTPRHATLRISAPQGQVSAGQLSGSCAAMAHLFQVQMANSTTLAQTHHICDLCTQTLTRPPNASSRSELYTCAL